MPDSATPASQMIRVPTVLIEAVKELTRLHRQGHTYVVLTGLQQLMVSIDSESVIEVVGDISADSKIESKAIAEMIAEAMSPIQKEVNKLTKELYLVQEKMEAIAQQSSQTISQESIEQVKSPVAFYPKDKDEIKGYETRVSLGKLFKTDKTTIGNWQKTGELLATGWEVVPGTEGSRKGERYRPITEEAKKRINNFKSQSQ